MFELESKNPNEITIKTISKIITIDFINGVIQADLTVGDIVGPGEFEIGEATIRGISVANHTKTIYDVEFILGLLVILMRIWTISVFQRFYVLVRSRLLRMLIQS